MSEFKPWKVVDSYYPSFKEVSGASFKISAVMFATDISFEQSLERSRDLELIAEAGAVRAETGLTPAQLQARVAELEAALRVAAESIIKLESIATESGAEAYDIACEEMEAWQAKRRKDGKEVGTQGSLVDGLAWVYERLDDLESGQ